MKVLVCGGRDYDDWDNVFKVLGWIHENIGITRLIEGGARGADHIAKTWRDRNNIDGKSVNAEWDKYGKAAGSMRNGKMLSEESPDYVIAFPGGRGTADMIRKSIVAGYRIIYNSPKCSILKIGD